MIGLFKRSRHPLAREITVVLIVKAAALATLYLLFFGPANRPHITPDAVDRHLLGAASPAVSAPAHGFLAGSAPPSQPRKYPDV